MARKKTSISVNIETSELLQTIRSCFQLSTKRIIGFDEIISNYVMEGIKVKEPKIAQILELVKNTNQDSNQEETGESNNTEENI